MVIFSPFIRLIIEAPRLSTSFVRPVNWDIHLGGREVDSVIICLLCQLLTGVCYR